MVVVKRRRVERPVVGGGILIVSSHPGFANVKCIKDISVFPCSACNITLGMNYGHYVISVIATAGKNKT